ncbi:MAG: NAD(P)/FAD-dependent oxidoreductase [Cytophagaceae bacterium]|nr:NAD(P)/FAD-dependent oxidoreductase [Cytophagaceae bacterium]
MNYETILIGGGLAGLTASIRLAQKGRRVLVIERKTYPFHRVCGEYVSNETRPFLQSLGFDPDAHGAANIQHFQFTAPGGRSLETSLDLGGFGLSRYLLDFELYKLAQKQGVNFLLGKTVERVEMLPDLDEFDVETTDGQTFRAPVVLGSFGKRTKLDTTLNRDFMKARSPYIGVKYHIHTDFPKDLIALHNFRDGYCGISAIETDRYCLCYLTTRENLRRHGSIPEMERAVLWRNSHLKRIFNESEPLYEKPEVINEISFAPKRAVENGILMVGDAAGLITPLCGNGMAMAMHGAKLAADLTDEFLSGKLTRESFETQYASTWRRHFAGRLWVGRQVQKLFGSERLSDVTAQAFGLAKPLLGAVIRATHGRPF